MSRWLLSRLIPAHKDEKEQQVLSFPEINTMSEIEYRSLVEPFHDTDDLTYHQYITTVQYTY